MLPCCLVKASKIDSTADVLQILLTSKQAQHYSLFCKMEYIRARFRKLSIRAKFYMKMKFTNISAVSFSLFVSTAKCAVNEAHNSSVILNVSILSSFIVYANFSNLSMKPKTREPH